MVYARDPTHGPHIHVAYEGKESAAVRIKIDDGKVIQARPGVIKAQDLREAVEWLKNNRAFAREEWDKLNPLVHERVPAAAAKKRAKKRAQKRSRRSR